MPQIAAQKFFYLPLQFFYDLMNYFFDRSLGIQEFDDEM